MRVGDEGYCHAGAVFAAPADPRRPDEGRGVASTARFLFPESDVYSELSPRARIHVRRTEDGFAIRMPPAEVPSRYLRRAAPGSLPVIAVE
jgi:hypothetical protein